MTAANGISATVAASRLLFIIDDEYFVRSDIRAAAEACGWAVLEFESCEGFLAAYIPVPHSCLVLDAHLPGMDGLDLVGRLRANGCDLPVVMVSGTSDIATAVAAMKAGVDDFFEKPLFCDDLMVSVARALDRATRLAQTQFADQEAAQHVASLTLRQAQVMALVVAGQPSKLIASTLGVSQRTVETHRAAIMRKMGAKSIPALARLAVAAAPSSFRG